MKAPTSPKPPGSPKAPRQSRTAARSRRGARDRVLDALQRTLVEKGPAAVTLEGVAADAGVSKGGLLYHFPSKDALITGLVLRLSEEADEEIERARASGGGVVRFYLDTSLPDAQEAALYWSVLAALRTADGVHKEAAETLTRIFGRWAELLHREVGDPVLAETVRLVGDGLYLSAVAGIPLPPRELVQGVFERLNEQVRACAAEADGGAGGGGSADGPAGGRPQRE